MKAIIGRKIGMTQVFDKKGIPQPVTIIEAGPCYISQIKTSQKDGYSAIQLVFGQTKKINKTAKGHLNKAKITKDLKNIKEFKVGDPEKYQPGQEIKVDIFQTGDKVDIIGISKGKGFAGVIKRHGFSRGPQTHGSHHHRRPGSIGSMFPEHVVKGKKMPGHLGSDRVTVKNLPVFKADADKNILMVRGAVPGSAKNIIQIKEVK